MRLQGMVGDPVTIRAPGGGWRPPERSGHSPYSGLRQDVQDHSASKLQHRGLAQQPRANPEGSFEKDGLARSQNTNANEVYDVEMGASHSELRDSLVRATSFSVHSRRQGAPRRAERHARHGGLTFWQRISALSLSIFIALSLLGMMTTLLASKLDAIEAQLETRSNSALYPGTSTRIARRPSRRLLADMSFDSETDGNSPRSSFTSGGQSFGLGRVAVDVFRAAQSFARLMQVVTYHPMENMGTATFVLPSIFALAQAAPLTNRRFSSKLPDSAHQKRHLLSNEGSNKNDENLKALLSLQMEVQKAFLNYLANGGNSNQVPFSGAAASAAKGSNAKELAHPAADSAAVSAATQRGIQQAMAQFSVPIPGQTFDPMKAADTQQEKHRAGHASDAPRREAGAQFMPPPQQIALGPSSSPEWDSPSSMAWSTSTAASFPVHPSDPSVGAASTAQRERQASSNHGLSKNASGPLGFEGLEMWDLPRGKPVCRIYRSCVLENGTIIVPEWMKLHRTVLSSGCGLNDVSYTLPDLDHSASPFRIGQKGASLLAGVLLNTSSGHRDVFGTSAPRHHMPHFVSDILKPLLSIETLMGSGRSQASMFRIRPGDSSRKSIQMSEAFQDLKPTLQLFESTMERPETDWVPKLANMFSNLGFEFAAAGKERSERRNAQAAVPGRCFRSVVTNGAKQYEPHGLLDPLGSNIFFKANGISRMDPAADLGSQRPCPITVTALTREGPRSLQGLPELERALKTMSPVFGIGISFKVVDFGESVPFEEQVHAMQRTNVLVATHGAGNANFMFMRPRSSVIEVFPFAYRAGPFNCFARVFGLDYRHAMSAPQTDVFKECMNRHEKTSRIRKYVFERWDEAVREESKNPGVHRLHFEKEFGEAGKSEGMTTRSCVRMQELQFNINQVTSMVIDAARQQCQRAQLGSAQNPEFSRSM